MWKLHLTDATELLYLFHLLVYIYLMFGLHLFNVYCNEFRVFEGTINVLCHNSTVEFIDNDNRVIRIIKKNYKKNLITK